MCVLKSCCLYETVVDIKRKMSQYCSKATKYMIVVYKELIQTVFCIYLPHHRHHAHQCFFSFCCHDKHNNTVHFLLPTAPSLKL